MNMKFFSLLLGSVLLLGASPGRAQVTLLGSELAYKSSGANVTESGKNHWRLEQNGFLGTFIQLSSAATVTFQLRASKSANDTATPQLRLVVADCTNTWGVTQVGTNYGTYLQTWLLPAGTHAVSVQYINDQGDYPQASPFQLNLSSLTITGAAVLNSASDANALAAADSYIANYRRGEAALTLLAAGVPLTNTPVRVRLKRHAFNFGVAAMGQSGWDAGWMTSLATNDVNYRNFLNSHFNLIVPENAGKWSPNEGTRDVLTLDYLDALLDYAEANAKRVRMHGVLWETSDPDWVKALQSLALTNAAAASELRAEISERIQYFVRDRARRYLELDAINEEVHKPIYTQIYGTNGVAGIYNEIKAAAVAAGASVRVVPNEFNIFQWSDDPGVAGYTADPYANWYRQWVETLRGAGGAVDGIGIQYYPLDDYSAQLYSPHSPARMLGALNNLAVAGLPLSLSEFAVQDAGSPSPARCADLLEQTLRLAFGHPAMTTFINWGFWAPQMWASSAALVDANWNLTAAGQRYEQLMAQWNTDVVLTTDAQGRVSLTGFYGEYEVVALAGKPFASFSLAKGQTHYSLSVRPFLAEDFEHEWADNALAVTTNGWTATGSGDASSVTNPAIGYAALPGGVPFPMSYDHAAARRILRLDTRDATLATPPADAAFTNAKVYADMMVNFVVGATLPEAVSNDVNLKAAVLLMAGGAATNLYVFHGRKTFGGFGEPVFTAVTNTVPAGTWCRLTLVFDAASGAGGEAEAFRVLINGKALLSASAYGDDWKTAVFQGAGEPGGGTWFLSAARRTGSAGLNPGSLGWLGFQGTGFVDDLVLTAVEPKWIQYLKGTLIKVN